MKATLSGSTRMPQKTPNSGARDRAALDGGRRRRLQVPEGLRVLVHGDDVGEPEDQHHQGDGERQAGEADAGLGGTPRRLGEEGDADADQRAAGRSPR